MELLIEVLDNNLIHAYDRLQPKHDRIYILHTNDFLNKVQLYKKKIKALTKNKSSILLLNIPEKTNDKIFNTLFLFKNGSIIYQKNKSESKNIQKSI